MEQSAKRNHTKIKGIGPYVVSALMVLTSCMSPPHRVVHMEMMTSLYFVSVKIHTPTPKYWIQHGNRKLKANKDFLVFKKTDDYVTITRE